MKRTTLLTALGCMLLAAAGANADLIAYDNLGATADFPFLASDAGLAAPAIDDLHIVQGGQLTQISFALIAQSFNNMPLDADILLAEDNGDGVPDFGPFGADPTLLITTATNINGGGFISTGNATVFDVNVSSENVNVTAGSTLWAMISLTRMGFPADVNTVFYGPIVTGSSDALVYQLNGDGSVSSVTPPNDSTSAGLGWQLQVTPEPTSAMLLLLGCGLIARRRNRKA